MTLVVSLDWTATQRDLAARRSAIARYRDAEAFLRTTAASIEQGCPDLPCAEAERFRRLANHAGDAAWREDHNPGPSAHQEGRVS